MAGTPITFRAAAQRFACGDEFKNLEVINFTGPGGGRVSAYCCNMNIDMDGDPQAYAPFGKAGFQPLDYLENSGWKPKQKNEDIKTKYEAKKKELGELEAKRKAATPTPTLPHPAGGAPVGTPPPATVSGATPGGAKPAAASPPVDLKALDKQVHDLRDEIHKLNPYPSTAKNYEKVFWHWYGVAAFKPGDEKREVYTEKLGTTGKTKQRSPQLDSTADADVYGKLPVVQSEFEPGPGYYVSVLPRVVNGNFKAWDQRSFLPPDATSQRSYGAVSTILTGATGLDLNDNVWALRLDDSTAIEFPFLDRGFQPKVAECSIAAFFDMGGETKTVPGRTRPVYVNNFLVLYVAFTGGLAPADVLAAYAKAPNADEFPLVLSFLAQRTTDAKRGYVSGDPLANYQAWKKMKPALQKKPAVFDTVHDALEAEGFKVPAAAAVVPAAPGALPAVK